MNTSGKAMDTKIKQSDDDTCPVAISASDAQGGGKVLGPSRR